MQLRACAGIMCPFISTAIWTKGKAMSKYLGFLGRILLAQIFLVQVGILISGFMNSPTAYQDYQMGLASHGLPGIFAPLIILIQLVGGLALLAGYKTRFVALLLAVYSVFISSVLGLPVLQYLAIAGGLLVLASHPSTALSLDGLKNSGQ